MELRDSPVSFPLPHPSLSPSDALGGEKEEQTDKERGIYHRDLKASEF